MAFGEMRYISIKTGATTPKANRIMNENNWATKSKLQVMILFAPSVFSFIILWPRQVYEPWEEQCQRRCLWEFSQSSLFSR